MNRGQAKQLLGKYENGTATADEVKLIENWYMAVSREQELDAAEADFSYMKALIWADTLKSAGLQEDLPKAKRIKLWPRIAAAVAAIAIVVSGVYFFTNYRNGRHPERGQAPATAQYNNIKPGTQGATLTLANGRKIKLSSATNGELAKEAGISITKTAAGQIIYNMSSALDPSLRGGTTNQSYNTLSTAKGETYILTLPDKSKVWLNAASSLTYTPALSDHGQRKVKLSGEAYFEIAKDKTHPFLVESNGQQVEVLGTHFNINAYSNEPVIKTTLLEGRVKVSSLSGSLSSLLTPGHQSILTGNEIKIQEVNTDNAIAWKNDQFMFNDEPLEEVMRKIGRWYNIDFNINDPALAQQTVYGTISRYSNVSKVLGMLEKTGEMKFEIQGNTIKVKRK